MNKPKPHRKPFKVVGRIGRGSCYNPKILEGKSNLTAKRVTLLTGFLASGVSSDTVKKSSKNTNRNSPKTKSSANIQRENLLNGDLQSFLQENNRHFRRSARILSKHLEQQGRSATAVSKYLGLEDLNKSTGSKDCVAVISPPSSPGNNKSILLKNTSKSIFSEINQRYSKRVDNKKTFQVVLEKNLPVNHSFCLKLKEDICVKFKSALLECHQKVLQEIECTNKSFIGGCIEKDEVSDKEVENMTDNPSEEHILFPKEQWVYKTPHKQRIVSFNEEPEKSHSQLQPGILCSLDQNVNNIYEFHSQLNIDPNQFFNTNQIDIDPRYMSKVGVIYKTPYKVGNNDIGAEVTVGNDFLNCVQRENDINNPECSPFLEHVEVDYSCRPCFSNTNHSNLMTTGFSDKLENPLFLSSRTPKPNRKLNFDMTNCNFINMRDHQDTNLKENTGEEVTFVYEGGDFKMQESQKAKRQKVVEIPVFQFTGNSCQNSNNMNVTVSKKLFDFSNSLKTDNGNVDDELMFNFSNSQ